MNFAKKSLGQNFLIDKNIINKIVSLTSVQNRNIIEIGPGNGALTDEIIKRNPLSLSIIEKDYNLFEKLKLKYLNNKKVKIYNNDILKFDIEKIDNDNSIIFGNLPYNISSQILVKIIKFKKWPPKFNDLILMFQKELGEKVIGEYLTSNYGRLSILSKYRLNFIKKFLVSPHCFFPKPKIMSLVLHFSPNNKSSYKIKKIDNLEKITNIFFSNKRKMINKNIRKIFSTDEINKIKDINLNSRPSEIAPEIYYKITEIFEKK
tara:strand:+ start:1407 stop:2192 length:786 start_codon:yes stop_codon:yes gene_type:complete